MRWASSASRRRAATDPATTATVPVRRQYALEAADSDSTHPDPRLVFAKTEAGTLAIRNRSQRVSIAARRLLMLFDGRRSLAQLPGIVPPAEMRVRLLTSASPAEVLQLVATLFDDGGRQAA